MEKRPGLIREACSLNRLDMLTRILEEAKSAETDELKHILDSFCLLKMFKNGPIIFSHSKSKLGYVLEIAARHGHLGIIRFLWPAMATVLNKTKTEAAIKDMMAEAGKNNHRSILEFLLWESGTECMQLAQKFINDAFAGAFGGGHVNLLKFLVGKGKDKKPVAPGLGLATLSWTTLEQAIIVNRKWNGIKFLGVLKRFDTRFANFELVDQDNTALCMACLVGNYNLVRYLLRRPNDGDFLFPLTNPATKNNRPLVNACRSGDVRIVRTLLERDTAGNYIYKGIDPSAQNYESIVIACTYGRFDVAKFLLEMNGDKYVLPGIKVTEDMLTIVDRRPEIKKLLEMHLLEQRRKICGR